MKEVQEFSTPAYLNPDLPVDERVEDLLSHMTLEEEISQMVYNAPAIPRLGIPEYNYLLGSTTSYAKSSRRGQYHAEGLIRC